MGGCRCYFRDCHVSSQKFPGMRFFRFPLKDAERFKKWRQYAKMDQILEFSEVRRRNTNICARHFRSECFMNYKMDRLTPSAVPTIIRLTNDKALDFELDIESGVLVNLEQPKLKHLLPPDDFECPLLLLNDKILLEKLNELQSEEYNKEENIEFIVSDEEFVQCLENSDDTTANSAEILESVQVAAPSLKRTKEKCNVENVATGKKCRILNASNAVVENDVKEVSTVVLTSIADEFAETIEIENSNELLASDNDDQLFLTSETYINDDYDEDLEIIEIHKNQNMNSGELPINDPDATVVQIKSQINTNVTQPKNMEVLEYNKLKQDFDELNIKYSILESENEELKRNSQQSEDIKRNHLLLQVENNNLKKYLKDFDIIRDKLIKCSEENRKLKNEASNNKTLKAELISRKEETKELRKLLEALKTEQPKKETIEFEAKSKEINGLRKKEELLQQQLDEAVGELKEVQANLKNVGSEKERLIQHEAKLKESLNNMQLNFDLKQSDYNTIKSNFEDLQLKQSELEQKYWKLQALQNQEATVSTSLEGGNGNTKPVPSVSVASLTKAQLFNGIKRYLCSSMVSLLRMEMYGSTEREWKTDERQVAVDILRLGEIVYKYFTDEWRIRLPALRDARNWLNQSQQLMEDEEDL